jgi:hypothetical protein
MVGSDDGTVDVVDPNTPEPLIADSAGLTQAQASTALTLLDDACSDAWCETEYQFAFRHISCNFPAATCTLKMTVTRGQTSYARACRMTALHSFKQLVGTAANGYQWLTDRFWTKVDLCASKVEATIP